MENDPITIKIDHREEASGIGEILSTDYRIEVIKTNLHVGDYIVNDNVIVERKTAVDFIVSTFDGRLFQQAERMKRYVKPVLFIVEGRNVYEVGSKVHKHSIKGAIVSITTAWRIPIIFSEDLNDTALFLWLIGNQMRDRGREVPAGWKKIPKGIKKRRLRILESFPEIGPHLAKNILEHFGTIERALAASEKELCEVPGIGKKKAKIIRKLIKGEE